MAAPFLAALFLLAAPPAAPAVVELADEDLAGLVGQLVGPNAKADDLKVERGDVFTGTEAVVQTGNERHVNRIKGWAYKIVETPKAADEFRYLRFAWRKEGGGSILLAFAVGEGQWSGKRYAAGPYNLGGSGVKVADAAPGEWTVVTRDLFKDFGPLTLSSILFSTSNAGTAYFDHVLLGRSVDDLDRASAAALGRAKPKEPLAGTPRDALWNDLVGEDKAKATAAFRTFLAVAPEQVAYVRGTLPRPPVEGADLARIRSLVVQLGSDEFSVRTAATDELRGIGPLAVPYLQAEADRDDSPEAQFRARYILKKLGVKAGDPPPAQARAARIVRLLERAGTADAKALLGELGGGVYGADYTAEARAALARLKAPR